MKQSSGGTSHSLTILLLLAFVAATEAGMSPGQRLLELTCAVFGLVLGDAPAAAVVPSRHEVMFITSTSRKSFDESFNKYTSAVPTPSSDAPREPRTVKERAVSEVSRPAASALIDEKANEKEEFKPPPMAF